jgi:hypothetical protein
VPPDRLVLLGYPVRLGARQAWVFHELLAQLDGAPPTAWPGR